MSESIHNPVGTVMDAFAKSFNNAIANAREKRRREFQSEEEKDETIAWMHRSLSDAADVIAGVISHHDGNAEPRTPLECAMKVAEDFYHKLDARLDAYERRHGAPEFMPQRENEPANFTDDDPDGGH